MSNKNKIILGMVGAAAAGVLVGLLLAPEKGADMRKKIKDTAGDWADQLGDAFASGKEKLASLKNKATSVAQES